MNPLNTIRITFPKAEAKYYTSLAYFQRMDLKLIEAKKLRSSLEELGKKNGFYK